MRLGSHSATDSTYGARTETYSRSRLRSHAQRSVNNFTIGANTGGGVIVVTGAAPVWTTTPLYVCVSVTVCPKVFVLVIVPTQMLVLVHVLVWATVELAADEVVLVVRQNGQIQSDVVVGAVVDVGVVVDVVVGVVVGAVVVVDGVVVTIDDVELVTVAVTRVTIVP